MAGNTGPKRTTVEKAANRKTIAAMYLDGKLQYEIAQELHLSTGTISSDLKIIQKEWLKETVKDFGAIKAKELARIDRVEREAWTAWYASKKEHQVSLIKSVQEAEPELETDNDQPKEKPKKLRKETSIRKESRYGDASFLAIIQDCIDKRLRIFGLYAPVKLNITDLDQRINEELALAKEAQQKAELNESGYTM